MENIFQILFNTIESQRQKIEMLATKLEQLEVGGGGSGNASIADYESGKTYKRNALLVDTATETVYRVIPNEYISTTVENDAAEGNLKLVGFESQVLTIDHDPTQDEIDALPDDTLVAIYSPTDTPYSPLG